MSTRFGTFFLLALMTAFASGFASAGTGVQETAGFFGGLTDGLLIMFKFLGGHLADAGFYDIWHTDSSYVVGYFLGASAFLAFGVLVASP